MKLIADSGATKTTWAFVRSGQIVNQIISPGISPYFMDEDTIGQILKDYSITSSNDIDEIQYYGSGCDGEANQLKIQKILEAHFPNTENILVKSDLFAAVKALCKDKKGIACILGTGSNTCYFDGEHIGRNIRGYGFILGDIGSGAALGKQLVFDLLFHQMPPHLESKLLESAQLSKQKILDEVYRGQMPSQFLASFAHFIFNNRSDAYILDLLKEQFSRFLDLMVVPYPEHLSVPVHFVGSIAYKFQDLIQELMADRNIKPDIFLKDPMENLVKYCL